MAASFKLFLGSQAQAAAVSGDAALATTGTGAATFVGASNADSLLAATGAAAVAFVGDATADAVLAATGIAAVAFAGEGIAETGALSTTGAGTASFVGAYDFTAIGTPGVNDDHVKRGSAYWKKYQQELKGLNKKKKKKLDTLDDLLERVRARIAPWKEAQEKAKVGEQIMLRSVLNRPVNMDSTLQAIDDEIRRVRTLIEEIDEEETLMMLMV